MNFNPYNNNPYLYNPYGMNNFQPNQSQPNKAEQHIDHVHGIEGAKAFPLPANSETFLLDDDKEMLYLKMTDSGGYATIKTYELKEVEPEKEPDINALFKKIEELEKRLDGKLNS